MKSIIAAILLLAASASAQDITPVPICTPPDIITVTMQAVVDDPTSGTVVVTMSLDLPSTYTVVLPIGPITVGEWWCGREQRRAATRETQRAYRLAKLQEETFLREEDVFFAVGQQPNLPVRVE
jgi:hypothetical protein